VSRAAAPSLDHLEIQSPLPLPLKRRVVESRPGQRHQPRGNSP